MILKKKFDKQKMLLNGILFYIHMKVSLSYNNTNFLIHVSNSL